MFLHFLQIVHLFPAKATRDPFLEVFQLRILNIPNILTLARIALIPVFLLVAYWPPAIGVNEHTGGMTRHLILNAILFNSSI